MTKDDAKKFPIMASATLFSLYLVFKYFNETVVKEVIFVYLLRNGRLSEPGSGELPPSRALPLPDFLAYAHLSLFILQHGRFRLMCAPAIWCHTQFPSSAASFTTLTRCGLVTTSSGSASSSSYLLPSCLISSRWDTSPSAPSRAASF